jgi:hypothetical protein
VILVQIRAGIGLPGKQSITHRSQSVSSRWQDSSLGLNREHQPMLTAFDIKRAALKVQTARHPPMVQHEFAIRTNVDQILRVQSRRLA